MEELTGFQRDLLYVILDSNAPSGQEIREKIESYYNKDVNHGRLYSNLDELVKLGLVVKGKKDERANYYQITQKGKDTIVKRHAWMNKFVENTPVHDEIKSVSN